MTSLHLLLRAFLWRIVCRANNSYLMVADIEDEFVNHLRVLVPRLLAPENLVKKEFGGQPIKARDLYKFFQTFMEVFKDIDLPEPTTLVEVSMPHRHEIALSSLIFAIV